MPKCVLLHGPQGMRWTITARQLARFVAAKVESCARTARRQIRARLGAQFRYISSLRIVTLPSRLSCHQAHQPEPNSIPSSRAASMRQTRNFSSKLSCMRIAPLPMATISTNAAPTRVRMVAHAVTALTSTHVRVLWTGLESTAPITLPTSAHRLRVLTERRAQTNCMRTSVRAPKDTAERPVP